MGFMDWVLGRAPEAPADVPFDTSDAAQRVLPDPYEPFIGVGIPVADPGVPLTFVQRRDVEKIWRSQPNVRKVVDFIARNVATIPLHTHERVADEDRQRVHDHPVAELMRLPRAGVAPYRFWHAVLSDALLYDAWAALLVSTEDGKLELVQVPSWRLWFEVDALRRVVDVWFWADSNKNLGQADGGWRRLDKDNLIYDHGYGPSSAGLSPLATLRDILDESAEAVAYRRQVWANGARAPQYVHRPVGAPPWSQEARERFSASFRAAYTGRGDKAGGAPLLEDGMELRSASAFVPQDTQDLEGRRLTSIEVASAYHIAPELVGAQQGNYSNIREFRQSLYRDNLGPYIASIEQTLNAQLVPKLADGRNLYVEANVESKLRGDFIEQAQVKSSATGAPWLTRNEARALENRPPVDGGDELVVPLNVLTGGQASPRDSGSQNLRLASGRPGVKALEVKSAGVVPERYRERVQKVFSDFFERQGRSVLSRIGAGDGDWWDYERWDRELTQDVYRVAVLVSTYVGERTAEAIGFEPDAYDVDRTLAYLQAVAERIAGQVNVTTFGSIEAALADDEDDDPEAAVAHVFDVAAESRAEQSGLTAATAFAGFAAAEAGRQSAGGRATKTWRVNSGNPRASHAAMDGETVPIDDVFSNGMEYPGGIGDVEEVAGCQCSLEINVPS